MTATTTPEADRIQNPVVLSFHDLDVKFTTEFGTVHAVQGISLDVRAGEIVALVGESGSGKSVTSMTSMGLLPRNARTGGSTRVGDAAIEKLDDRGIRRVRGAEVAMVFQEPMTALNPVQIGRASCSERREVPVESAPDVVIGRE